MTAVAPPETRLLQLDDRRTLARPDVRASVVPDLGHFMVFDYWAEILDWLMQ